MNREDLRYLTKRLRLKFGLHFTLRDDLMCSRLAQTYLIAGRYKRIYHYHIRKTGGTSINHMFLETSGEPSSQVYESLNTSSKLRVTVADKIFVGWNRRLIEQGNYYYAFSHIPAHQIKLRDKTFTITCLRDPVRRLLSHYHMLLEYRESGVYRPSMEVESKWLGAGFSAFIDNIPRKHLQSQLHMFSENFDVGEALERIMNCSYLFFTDSLDVDAAELGKILGIDLRIGHARKSSRDSSLNPDEIRLAEIALEPELRLYEELQKYRKAPD